MGLRTQILLGIVLAVVIASVISFVVFVYLPAQPSGPIYTWVSNGSTISGGNCTHDFPNTLPVSEYSQNKSIVFLMQPNSTAQICVTYRVQEAQLTSPQTYGIFQDYLSEEHYTCNANSCVGTGYPAYNVTMSSTPSSITIYPGNPVAKYIIVYTIQAGPYAKGFFALTFLNSCTQDIPFAIGQNTSQVNASNFYGYFRPDFGCSEGKYIGYEDYLSYGNITGISNLSFTYISANFTSP